MTRSRFLLLTAALLALGPAIASAGPFGKKKSEEKLEAKRAKIDAIASQTLARVSARSPEAKELLAKAFGHAVFDNTKVALGVSGGGGRGVAVESASGEHSYMRMGTVGVGIGLGAQSYQVVFAFETEAAFRRFVDEGWEADAGASAVAGSEGANAETGFRNGVAHWKLTEAGLMAHADLAGTKYWKNDNLN